MSNNNNKLDKAAILIVGSPRSGTTWIGKTFDSHPDTLYRHEPDSVSRSRELPLIIEPEDYTRYQDSARAYLDRMVRQRDPKTSGRLPVFAKSYYGPVRYRARHDAVLGSKLGQRAGLQFAIPDFVGQRSAGSIRVVWKSIESVGRAALFATLWPSSTIIHVVRHPCGHIASTLRGDKLHKFDAAESVSEDRGLFEKLQHATPLRQRGLTWERLAALTPVQRLAWRWVAYNEPLMRDAEQLSNVKTVVYEAICEEPLKEFRALFDFCRLDWAAQTEQFLQRSIGDDSAGYYSVIKNPARSANRWREELTAEDIEQILEIVKDTAPGKLFV